MDTHGTLVSYRAFTILILITMSLLCKSASEDREVHIVYLGSLPDDPEFSPLSHHLSVLQRVVQESSIENLLVRSYRRSFNGFVAKLTEQEREKIAKMKDVVSVFPSKTFHPQTTRSWDFIGLNVKSSRNLTVESDIIVGVIDTGIWPESESFNDEGFGPAPKKWKGTCKGGKNFTCNNKLIGARYYVSESARDELGHGTHTASTAAGNAVKDVSFYGLAKGTARGGAPAARIAAYKVCDQVCTSEGILAAFDDAIADGVDIITISLASEAVFYIDMDPIAIGAFHATKKGILTSQGAGNGGQRGAGTVRSVAPWILTTAASSIDRRIINKVVLADGKTLVGNCVNTFTLNATSFPLIYGEDASRKNCTGGCHRGCLDSDSVKGKIVVCDAEIGDIEAHRAGALGSILRNYYGKYNDLFQVPILPATILMTEDYEVVRSYMSSTRDPQANIFKSEVIKDPTAPTVAYFSGRGPNELLKNIIKPDITAPGVEIVAAYSPVASPTPSSEDTRRAKYNIMTGTSMSCPHAAAAAAYVKSFHPNWSPEAVKSSLMTTAWPMNNTYNSSGEFSYGSGNTFRSPSTANYTGEFAYGSGHINPVKAVNPGLVYEASIEDYIRVLCTIYDEGKVRLISGDNSTTCPQGSEKGSEKDLNYPSMGVKVDVEPNKPFTVKFSRRVKNVGLANSTYKAEISVTSSKGDIKVVPESLSFVSLNEEKTYEVTVTGSTVPGPSQVSASLVWSDGIHSVRSPIIVYV